MSFFTGTRGGFEQRSTLSPEQQSLFNQLIQALSGQGGGGAFGSIADYYRDLLSDDSKNFDSFAAPEQRRFREEIIPGLAEQFAGMGSGALSSSGFRNAGIQAGTDLSERLGALRAQLRQQGAAGLAGLGQQGLSSTVENIYRPGEPGLLHYAAQGLGSALPGIGSGIGNFVSNFIGKKTNPLKGA